MFVQVVMSNLEQMTAALDQLDGRLIRCLAEQPRASVVDLARRLGVARGTVQARLDKLVQRRLITGFGPDVDVHALGYEVMSFTTLEIAQGRLSDVVSHLTAIPEVLEVHSVTGSGDLMCRIVARTNAHLQQVINRILEVQGIGRTQTVIALEVQVAMRVLPLVEASASASLGDLRDYAFAGIDGHGSAAQVHAQD
ncbi:MAG: Lrp/AsnC family transcriptional regulator [Acidimicrobiales bacterium]